MIEKIECDYVNIYLITNESFNEEGSCGKCSCCINGESDICDNFFNEDGEWINR